MFSVVLICTIFVSPLYHPLPLLLCIALVAILAVTGLLLLVALGPQKVANRIKELRLNEVHRVKKTERNGATYYFDHVTSSDGELIVGQLRFAWGRDDGEEITSLIHRGMIRVRLTEGPFDPTVSFVFDVKSDARCGFSAKLNDDPNWWLAAHRMTETGLQSVVITLTREQLEKEVYLWEMVSPSRYR